MSWVAGVCLPGSRRGEAVDALSEAGAYDLGDAGEDDSEVSGRPGPE